MWDMAGWILPMHSCCYQEHIGGVIIRKRAQLMLIRNTQRLPPAVAGSGNSNTKLWTWPNMLSCLEQ
jgi:hypothetical protein